MIGVLDWMEKDLDNDEAIHVYIWNSIYFGVAVDCDLYIPHQFGQSHELERLLWSIGIH